MLALSKKTKKKKLSSVQKDHKPVRACKPSLLPPRRVEHRQWKQFAQIHGYFPAWCRASLRKFTGIFQHGAEVALMQGAHEL